MEASSAQGDSILVSEGSRHELGKQGDVEELLKTLFFVAVVSSKRSAKLAAVAREDINFRGNSLVLPSRANF